MPMDVDYKEAEANRLYLDISSGSQTHVLEPTTSAENSLLQHSALPPALWAEGLLCFKNTC